MSLIRYPSQLERRQIALARACEGIWRRWPDSSISRDTLALIQIEAAENFEKEAAR